MSENKKIPSCPFTPEELRAWAELRWPTHETITQEFDELGALSQTSREDLLARWLADALERIETLEELRELEAKLCSHGQFCTDCSYQEQAYYDSYRQSCISGHHCPLDDNLPRNVLRWAVMRTKRMMKKEIR